jgi:hypothetical protein
VPPRDGLFAGFPRVFRGARGSIGREPVGVALHTVMGRGALRAALAARLLSRIRSMS